MSRVYALFTLLVIAVLGSQIGFSSEMKIGVGSPSNIQKTVKDQHLKAKYEKIKTGIYRDLKWYRQVKLSALDYVYPDQARYAAVLYKFEPSRFIDVVTWKDVLKEMELGHLVFADLKMGKYEISNDSNIMHQYVKTDPELIILDKFLLEEIYKDVGMKVLLSTRPDLFDQKYTGKVVSWKTGVPVTKILSTD